MRLERVMLVLGALAWGTDAYFLAQTNVWAAAGCAVVTFLCLFAAWRSA